MSISSSRLLKRDREWLQSAEPLAGVRVRSNFPMWIVELIH